MKKYFIILCFLFLQIGFAQQSGNLKEFSADAAEEIFIHFNSPLLLPGESLYYKVYNLIKEDHTQSDISKVANVQLQNSRGEVVFHHKLSLENGANYSDYLIPSELPSGIYTLIGYTNWMKNYDLKGAFESQVLIINPYIKNSEKNISISEKEILEAENKDNSTSSKDIKIDLSADSFEKRNKVSFSLAGDQDIIAEANISISVRKVEDINGLAKNSSKDFNNSEIESFEMRYLPEMRGRIISGQIKGGNNTKLNKKLEVAYYVPNTPGKFRIFETSRDGSFKFTVEEPVDYEEVYLKLTEALDTDLSITIDSSFIEYRTKKPQEVLIPVSVKNDLEQRAVYNQIQQSYIATKSDSIIRNLKEGNFFGEKATVYDLDEYTRFSTMEEVFVEIIQFASFKKEGDTYIPNISEYNSETDFGNPPLLLIDGIMVRDYNDFYYMDAKLIEKISIVRDKYFYGPVIYQGIIIVETINEDVTDLKADHVIALTPTEPLKNYYSPDYSSAEKKAELSRIPDYRTQLLWQPEINGNQIEFFTSDITGKFKIKIEGFQKNGQAISIEKTFEVTE